LEKTKNERQLAQEMWFKVHLPWLFVALQ